MRGRTWIRTISSTDVFSNSNDPIFLSLTKFHIDKGFGVLNKKEILSAVFSVD